MGTSQSDRQPNSFLRTQSYRRPDSFGHSQADKQTSSVEQTTCSKRRQYLYTAACGLAVRTPTQALANQRPQLQLRLQLARTQPSSNGIKMRASISTISTSSIISTSIITSSSALGESSSQQQPHLQGQKLYAP
jgi:hypothetical protein